MIESRERPKQVALATYVMSFFNLASFGFYEPAHQSFVSFAVLVVPIIVVSFVILWQFWLGRNWARRLVLATSVLALLNLFAVSLVGPLAACIIVAEALVGMWLLFSLNKSPAKSFFQSSTRSSVASPVTPA